MKVVVDTLLSEPLSASLFLSDEWLACYAGKATRYAVVDEHESIRARFVLYSGGRGWLKTWITPPGIPNIGLEVYHTKSNTAKQHHFHKQVIEVLATFLRSSKRHAYKIDLPTHWIDTQPLQWQGFEVKPRYTYRVALSQSEELMLQAMDSSKRNKIHKAQREGYSMTHEPAPAELFDFVRMQYKQASVFLHSEMIERMLHLLSSHQGVWTGVYKDGKLVAANVCAVVQEEAINLFSGVDKDHGTAAGPLCLYESMLECKRRGLEVFDFEGSSVPSIEQYFRSFGGMMTTYFTATSGKTPWRQWLKYRS
ncbi:MAG: GNAT family N-acetyltransferase [Flavobacteriales bacterium]